MIRKDVKKKKHKLTDEQKRDQIAAALKRKKECARKALEIVSRLTEETPSKEWLVESLNYINQDYYNDLTTERSIVKLCGYPICVNDLQRTSAAKFHISLRDKKVYDREERSKYCSGFCFKASSHLKSQLNTEPLWIREEVPITKISFLEENQNKKAVQISGKGDEVELVAIAKPPPDDDLNSKQVVVLENMGEDGEIRINDILSGDQIYSTSYKDEKSARKSILKKPGDENCDEQPTEPKHRVTISEPNKQKKPKEKVSFNSEYTGLSETVIEINKTNPEDLFEQELDNMSAGDMIKAMKQLKQLPQNIVVKSKSIDNAEQEIKKSKIIECENPASEVVIDTLLEWFSAEAVRLVHRLPAKEAGLQQGDEEDKDSDGEEADNAEHQIQDLTVKLNDIEVKNESKFHIDQLLIEETEIFANKFSAYMKGKEAYEDSSKILEKEDDDGREPCLPLLDRHAQVQHRIIVVLDQLARFGTPIYQLLGLPIRLVQTELKTIIRSLKLTAENVSLKPLEWRIISIFIIYMLSEKSEELSRAIKSKTYVKNIEILLQEFGLDPQILEKTKNNICDLTRFKNLK